MIFKLFRLQKSEKPSKDEMLRSYEREVNEYNSSVDSLKGKEDTAYRLGVNHLENLEHDIRISIEELEAVGVTPVPKFVPYRSS